MVDGIVVELNAKARIASINQSGCEILGYTREQLLGKNWIDTCIPETDRQQVKLSFDRVISGESSQQEYIENPVLLSNGEQRIMRWHNRLLRTESDGVFGSLSFGVDVTPLRESQQALHESETRFRAFMDHSPLAAVIKGGGSKIQYANAAWAGSFNISLEQALGRTEAELFPEVVAAEFVQGDQQVLDESEPLMLTLMSHQRAKVRWWRVVKFPIKSSQGERWLGQLAWDITDTVQTHNHLVASEAYAKAVLDTAVDAIIHIDVKGDIQAFNGSAQRMFAFTAAEVIGRNVKLLMPEPYHSQHDGYLENYIDTGKKKIIGIGREVTAQRKDGSQFPIHLAVSEVQVGDTRGFTGIIRDLSDDKLREQELLQRKEEARVSRERLTRMTRISTLGEMAAGIAHEINQPLTAIANYAEACRFLVNNNKISAPEMLQTLAKMSAQAQRAGEVIRKMRNLVRQKGSEHKLEDINAVINDCVVLADFEGRLRNIGIELKLSDNLLPVYIDQVQIQQVILNLLRNAQDAMEALDQAPPIEVVSKQLNNEIIEVSVRDWGQGIDAANEVNLYQHFFSTKEAGMGIGLAVSRSIIEAHDGKLWFTRNPDAGVTFHFNLPVAMEQS